VKLQILQLPVEVLQRIDLLMQLEQHKRKQPGLQMLLRTKVGITRKLQDLTSNQVKQNASGFLGTAQDKANEIARAVEEKSEQAKDSATCTWNSTKDKASNIAATAQDTADSTLKSTKE